MNSGSELRNSIYSLQKFLSLSLSSPTFKDVTNNGKPMNPSLSEDSVAETALAKKNSDGK
jgi:glutaredoxin-related protein